MRKTKIICTLGPSTDQDGIMRGLIENGMDVARFNFSHGDYEEHGSRFRKLCQLREELGRPVAAMLDTKGPEIRTGEFEGGSATIKTGSVFTLTPRPVLGNDSIVSITFEGLHKDVHAGTRILLDDGLIEMVVEGVENGDIHCRVQNGGTIRNRRGVNVPSVHLSMPYLSDKDRSDILFGVEMGYDFIAASFTRCADDILQIRALLEEHGGRNISIIAKIENNDGVKNIDEILRVVDGIMIARGDMGVEIPLEEVPIIQKMLIKKTYNSEKQVITATQMLDSMMKNPRPTRAEATDVANAIYDGTSAIMLSGETAAGLYPLESVRTMATIAERAERDIDYAKRFRSQSFSEITVANAIAHATCTTAHDLGAAVTVTKSGKTAKLISKFRPAVPIVACCMDPAVCRMLSMSWGVTPILIDLKDNTDELFDQAVLNAQEAGLIESGELAVLTAGVPLGVSGTTNMMKVHIAGDVLITGAGNRMGKTCGNLCVCPTEEDALARCRAGDILVIPETTNALVPLLRGAAGIITEKGGANSHAAILGLAMGKPVITGASEAVAILRSGRTVMLDSDTGRVCTAKK